jgi:phosphonate transport system substrate-binding protein
MGLLMGGYDAGGIAEEVYAEYRERGIRELTRSKPLSTHMFIATARLSETDERLVEELLHGLGNDPVGRRVIEAIGPSVTGFVPATDSDYDGVREIFRTLRVAGVEP